MSETTLNVAEPSSAPAGNMRAAVRIENVSKVYSQRWFGLAKPDANARHALKNVSFTINEGEMVGLLGPNGSGKTTLLKSMATLLSVTSGRITVFGQDVNHDTASIRRIIGLVTCDERSFYWRLSGRKNLEFFAALYKIPEGRVNARIDLLLGKLGLTNTADRPYHGYSTGMRQKLAIARGLLGDPRIILYDEPTRSLDPISAENIRQWIIASRSISPSTVHLIATNQLREAEQLCERLVILNQGILIADGSVNQIRDRVQKRSHLIHHVTVSQATAANPIFPAPQRGLFGVEEEPSDPGTRTLRLTTDESGEGLTWVLNQILVSGSTIVRCETEHPRFDEVFCSLILGDTPPECRSSR